MRVTGGPPQTLAPARRALGASWSPSGDIVFAAERGATISRVAETGGDPVVIRRANERKGWAALRWPHVLPDGRHFLYLVRSDDLDVQGIYLGDLRRPDASDDRRVVAADSNVFFGSGHIAFVRRGQLHAQPFDPVDRAHDGHGVSHRGARGSGPVRRRLCDVRVVGQRRVDLSRRRHARSPAALVRPHRQARRARSTTRGNSATWPCRATAGWWRTSRWTRTSGTRDIWVRDLVRDTRLRLTVDARRGRRAGLGPRRRDARVRRPARPADRRPARIGRRRPRRDADHGDGLPAGLVAGRQASWPWKSRRRRRAAT